MTIGVEHFYQQMNDLYPVPHNAVSEAQRHALDSYPQESCGIVYGGTYHPCTNTADNPGENYRISLQEQNRICTPDKIESVIHSHTRGQEGVTASDLRSQIAASVPYGVVTLKGNNIIDTIFVGDTMKIADYEQRPFKSGVYDCFSLVRDWYRKEHGLLLPNYPRDAEWWTDAEAPNLLEENLEREGFVEISAEEVRLGDAFLAKPFRTLKVCHCGVFVGEGQILHHFGTPGSGRMSVRESVYDVQRSITSYIRHKDFPHG